MIPWHHSVDRPTIQVFTGKIPFFQKKNDSSVIFAVLDGGRPELPPSLLKQEILKGLVQECWDQEPSKRPTSRAVSQRLRTGTSEVRGVALRWYVGANNSVSFSGIYCLGRWRHVEKVVRKVRGPS